MQLQEQIVRMMPLPMRPLFENMFIDYSRLQEIRIRMYRPIILLYDGQEAFLSKSGKITNNINNAYCTSKQEITMIMEIITGFSRYAFEEEISQGFLTVEGGHRIGLSGKAVMDGEHVETLKYISGFNIRLAHEVVGCAKEWIPWMYEHDRPCHILLISPPCCGKTTLLRDMIRIFSNGNEIYQGVNVGVVDERSEIAGCYQGCPTNDVGIRSDILDGCRKAEGIRMLLRTMSPSVIAVDEIGGGEDQRAVEEALYCGCKILASVHGESLEEVRSKPFMRKMMEDKLFDRYFVLERGVKPGQVRAVYDRNFINLKEEKAKCS